MLDLLKRHNIFFVNIVVGLALGCVIGTPSMHIYFQGVAADCTRASSQASCSAVAATSCVWLDGTRCVASDANGVSRCPTTSSATICAEGSVDGITCALEAQTGRCRQTGGWGWATFDTALVGCTCVVGALAGTLGVTGTPSRLMGVRLRISCAIGVAGAILSLLAWLGSASHTPSLLIPGLFLLGAHMGAGTVLAPTLVSALVPAAVVQAGAGFFQVAVTGGLTVLAFEAMVLYSGVGFSPNATMAILTLVTGALAAGGAYVADRYAMPQLAAAESTVAAEKASSVDESTMQPVGGAVGRDSPSKSGPQLRNTSLILAPAPAPGIGIPLTLDPLPPLNGTAAISVDGSSVDVSSVDAAAPAAQSLTGARLDAMRQAGRVCGIVLAVSLQLTGINAIMGYAPRITMAAGVANPLVGNFLVMAWNCFWCIPAMALAGRVTPLQQYVGALIGVVGGCITTWGALVLGWQMGCLFGILLFVASFELGMGPMYYCLITDIFDPEFRPTGVGFVNQINFASNIAVVFIYPLLVSAFTTGGNSDTGVARVFLLFGVIGALCVVAMRATVDKTYLVIAEKRGAM